MKLVSLRLKEGLDQFLCAAVVLCLGSRIDF
jgi:hypothetical protein